MLAVLRRYTSGLFDGCRKQQGAREAVVTPGIPARNEGSHTASDRYIEREDGEYDLSIRIITMSQDEPESSL